MNVFMVLFFEGDLLARVLRVEASSRLGALIRAVWMLDKTDADAVTAYEVHPAKV